MAITNEQNCTLYTISASMVTVAMHKVEYNLNQSIHLLVEINSAATVGK